jgi:hypothetical protein
MRNGAGNDSGDTGISAHSRVSLRLELNWQSDATEHCDVLCVTEVSLAHGCLPHALRQGLMGCSIGERVELAFEPGHVRPKWAEARLLRLDPSRFNRRFVGRGPFEPRMGRFYPLAMLSGFQAQPNQARGSFRVAGISAQQLVADLNLRARSSIGVPSLVYRQISSMARLDTAMQPLVQSSPSTRYRKSLLRCERGSPWIMILPPGSQPARCALRRSSKFG